MSTRTEQQQGGGGLSATTLAIASVSSIVAAYVVNTFWSGGTILGAGLTPIIVAVVSESLKRPTQKLSAIREERRVRSRVSRRTPEQTPVAPPPELERPDPFGIWEADKPASRFHWVRGRALKLAVVTGVLAFAIGALVVTSADLVFGDEPGGDRLTIVPGKQERKDRDEKPTTTTTTQPTETTETVPPQTQTVPPTTPTEPPPVTGTTPTPAPAPEQQAPEQQAPQPQPAPEQQQPTPTPAPQQ